MKPPRAFGTTRAARDHHRSSAAGGCRRLPGDLKMAGAVLERPVIEKVLNHLGLEPPPKAPAHAPVRHKAG